MTRFLNFLVERGGARLRELRRLLGISARQKVAFEIDDNEAEPASAGPSLEEVYGSVRPLGHLGDFERLTPEAWEEDAERPAAGLCGCADR